MKNFLLIHGASHGAWCWEKVVSVIEEYGHKAFTIDLPGHGADKTPRGEVTIDSYIKIIFDFIEANKIKQLTIVGHSLAGTLLPRVACSFRENIDEVIFLAAIVLDVGERAIDYIPQSRRPSYFAMAENSNDSTFMVKFSVARQVFFNDLSDADAHHYYEKLTPQPIGVYLEKAVIPPSKITCHKRYIVCKQDNALEYHVCLNFAKQVGGVIHEVDAGHDIMLSQPETLAYLIMGQK